MPFLTKHLSLLIRYDATYLGASVMETTSIPGKVLTLWQDDATEMLERYANAERLILVGFSLGATVSEENVYRPTNVFNKFC